MIPATPRDARHTVRSPFRRAAGMVFLAMVAYGCDSHPPAAPTTLSPPAPARSSPQTSIRPERADGGGCTVRIAPSSATAAASGAAASVAVESPADCSWAATSNAPWIAVSSGSSGAGPGIVGYSVAANPSSASRTGTIDVTSQTFTVTQAGAPCTATLSSSSQSVPEGGGSGSVNVTLPDGCAWTATSGVSWIAVTDGSSGSGAGTLTYSVSANPSGSRRTGTIEIAGQTFTVTQAGASCTATLSPASQSFSADGGAGTVNVTIPDGCVWQASSSGFVSVTSVTGIGAGSVSYTVAANATGNSRTQAITIAGQSFVVSQSAAPVGPGCTATLSPTSQTFSSTGGSGDVTVSTQDACAWTAASNAAFITISGGASGTGSGFVHYSLGSNTSTDSRSGTMTIAGQTFTVTQTGSCSGLAVSPSSQSFNDSGGTGTVTVTAPAGCAWQAAAFGDFVTITDGSSGVGPGTVTYRVAANTTGMSRQQIISIGGQQVMITQSASGVPTCNATLSPTSANVGEGAATGSLAVTIPAGCAWTATSRDSFLTITSGSNNVGSGTVGYAVAANSTGSSRSGTLTVAQQVFTVTQSGVSCRATLSPSSATVSEGGGSGSISVTIAAGCSWTATSDASWATITNGSSGTGPGTVTYNVPANSTGSTRSGALTIAQQRFELTQSGPSCGNASISPSSASFTGAGGTGSVTVTIPAGCAWQASAGGFVTITSGSSGVGPGTVTYSVESNTTGSSRNHSISIAGRSFMVSQSTSDAPNCRATLSPSSASVTGSATSGSVSVSIPSGCSWTASSNASFITVTGGSSGTGSGSVSYSVSELTPGTSGYPSRNGTITIAQQTFTLTQTAPTCGSSSVSISPESASFTGAGGSGSVSVTIPAGCAWQAFGGSFVTITSGSNGVGPGTVSYSVEPNLTGASRNHSITIAGRPFMVSQSTDGAPNCRATLSPSSASVTGSATSGSVSVSIPSGCSWTASSNASFITVTGGSSGTGSGSVSYSVAELTSSTPGYPSRSGTITIAQQSFTVTQTAPTCGSSSVTISPTSANFTAAGGTGTVTVTIPAGCAWQAFGGNFVTITSGANSVGPGTVTYSVAPNTTGASRNHSIAIAGHPFMVSQAAQ